MMLGRPLMLSNGDNISTYFIWLVKSNELINKCKMFKAVPWHIISSQ